MKSFINNDIVKFNNVEHKVISSAITTRHEDDDVNKPEYITEEKYILEGVNGHIDVSELEFVRHEEHEEALSD